MAAPPPQWFDGSILLRQMGSTRARRGGSGESDSSIEPALFRLVESIGVVAGHAIPRESRQPLHDVVPRAGLDCVGQLVKPLVHPPLELLKVRWQLLSKLRIECRPGARC